jgi:cysteine desulfurase
MLQAYNFPLNNSSTHQLGRKASQIVEEARTELQNLLNAKNYEVIFTGSSTEATNTVLFGSQVNHILFAAIEHAAVYECRPADTKIIEFATLENGLVDLVDLKQKLDSLPDGNFLVSTMLANNETGAIQPVAEIAKLVHQKGGLFHCDLVPAVGKIEIDLEKLNIDFASVSAHKIKGPQGVGALLLRKGLNIKPLIYGGKQEKSKRAGSTNIAGISGFGEACKQAKLNISAYENVKKLRDFLENQIKKIGGLEVQIFADQTSRLPNTSYISLKNADSQTQLINFDLNGICVSSGPACSSGTATVSRTLKAMKVAPDFVNGAIRVSLGTENTQEEIEKFITIWNNFYQKTKAKNEH